MVGAIFAFQIFEQYAVRAGSNAGMSTRDLAIIDYDFAVLSSPHCDGLTDHPTYPIEWAALGYQDWKAVAVWLHSFSLGIIPKFSRPRSVAWK